MEKITPGIVASLGLCTREFNHSNAFDYEKLSTFDATVFVGKNCTACIPKVEEFIQSGGRILNYQDSSSQDDDIFSSDGSLAIIFLVRLVNRAVLYTCRENRCGPEDTPSTLSTIRLVYGVLSAVYSYLNSSYVCGLSMGAQIVVRSLTQSRTAIEFMHCLLPGAVSNSYLKDNARKAVENVPDLCNLKFRGSSNVLLVVDNNGCYDVKQCESTAPNADNALAVSIWANVAAATLSPQTVEPFIQTIPEYAPSLWKPFTECPRDLLDFGNTSISAIKYGNQARHLDIYQHSLKMQAADIFAHREEIVKLIRCRSMGNDESDVARKALLDTICLKCSIVWHASHSTLPCVCGSKAYGLIPPPLSSNGTAFLRPTKPQNVGNVSHRFSFQTIQTSISSSTASTPKFQVSYVAKNSVESSHRSPYLQSSSDASGNVVDSSKVEQRRNSKFVFRESAQQGRQSSFVRALYEPLPSILVNPGSHESMRFISDQ